MNIDLKIKNYPKIVNLQNCEDEPIHLIPQVQNHGFLFILDSSDKIIQISDNAPYFLNATKQNILTKKISDFFLVKELAFYEDWKVNATPHYSFTVTITKNTWLCIPHKEGKQFILDFEKIDEKWDTNLFQQNLLQIFTKLSNTHSLQALCDSTADEIKQITDYDRVMIYRFDKDWNGLVIAEAKETYQTAFKGLKYPASDIPKQARDLFLKQGIRILSNVEDTYSTLTPKINPETDALTSIGKSHLRGSSPIHIEYLKNMGVCATLNCAIIHEDKLWGLISCHHNSPKFVDYRKRQSCTILANMFASQIGQKLSDSYIKHLNKASKTRSKITENISKDWDIMAGLTAYETNGLSLFDCTGFTILHNNEIISLGITPNKKETSTILEQLHQKNCFKKDYFTTECLSGIISLDDEQAKLYSGIFVCKLSNAVNEALVWYRQEQPSEINWGGDPNSKKTHKLSPRKSFEKWTEKVRYTSKPWTSSEISNGKTLNNDIKNVIITKFGELELLNKKLNSLNQELESFSYSVSHDLRGPLRGIDGFAQILLEDYSSILDEEGKESLNIIINSADKMNTLMDEILNYSSISQYEITYNQIDVRNLCNEIIKDFNLKKLYPKTNFSIQNNIPKIYGDKTMTYQLFANLITNAFKYSSLSETPYVNITSYQQDANTIYTIKDNGIGFNQKYADKIFGVFTRLESNNYEGTGVGLAIAQRIVMKHNGNIWVNSEEKKGATFYFYYS